MVRDRAADSEEAGLPADVTARTKVVRFNDAEALAAALEPRDVAMVLTEAALTAQNKGQATRANGSGHPLNERIATRESSQSYESPREPTEAIAPCSPRRSE